MSDTLEPQLVCTFCGEACDKLYSDMCEACYESTCPKCGDEIYMFCKECGLPPQNIEDYQLTT